VKYEVVTVVLMNVQVFWIYYTVMTRNLLPVFHRSIMAPISSWTA